MASCILPDKLAEYRKALKDKSIDIPAMIRMTTEERTAEFAKFAGADAKKMNTLFEEKLVLKNRLQGLKNFINKTAELKKYSTLGKIDVAKEMSEYKARQQERILSPKEHEAYLNDLADKMLGTHIPKEVAQKAFELSAKANELRSVNPKLTGVSDEYLNAKQEFNDYVNAQKPLTVGSSLAKDLAIIGRNNLLLNPSTPIKTSIGQTINSAMDFVTRRLGMGKLQGVNPELTKQANKEAWETFQKTGMNTAAMESMDDTHVLGKGENFKLPAGTVKGKIAQTISKVAAISNKVAITWEHQVPFTKFYQKSFFDMLNLSSSDMAHGDQAKAAEIFKDACRIEPQTQEGAMLRLEAQKQAARITNTNETLVSRFSLATKNVLNKVFPEFPLGDFIMPIAKIPASIIANGIDNAGGGVPIAIKDIFQGREKMQSLDLPTKYEGMAQFHNGMQRVMRIGGTIGTAMLIASQFTKKDFRTDNYGTHFVKIGNTWINTEYINAISPSLAGAMMVKGMGDHGVIENTEHYVAGAAEGLKQTPGMEEASKLVEAFTNKHMGYSVEKYMKDFFSSRGVPSFIHNLLNNRPIDRLFWGAHGVESTEDVREDKIQQKKKFLEAKRERAKQ